MKGRRQTTPLRSRPRAPWNKELSRLLRESLDRHQHLRRRFIQQPSADGLHALRTQIRRQLALVALAAGVGGTGAEGTRRLLERCLRATGALRDTDVLIVGVDKLLPEHPELKKFRRHLRRRQRRATASVQRRLQRRRRKLSRRLRALAAEMDGLAPVGRPADALGRPLRETAEEVRQLLEAARRDETQLHRARIALKQLRYLVEALGDLLPGGERSWADALRHAQHAMGEVNDLDVLGVRLGKYTSRRPRERRRLRGVKAAVTLRQRRLRRKLGPGAPPLPARLQRLLRRSRKTPANYAGR